jgi:hypothetical protein
MEIAFWDAAFLPKGKTINTVGYSQVLKKLQHALCNKHPIIRSDLTPSDYHLYRTLKDHMRGQHYKNNDAFQEAMHNLLQGAGINFYCSSIFELIQCWQNVWIILEISEKNDRACPYTITLSVFFVYICFSVQ